MAKARKNRFVSGNGEKTPKDIMFGIVEKIIHEDQFSASFYVKGVLDNIEDPKVDFVGVKHLDQESYPGRPVAIRIIWRDVEYVGCYIVVFDTIDSHVEDFQRMIITIAKIPGDCVISPLTYLKTNVPKSPKARS